MPFFSIGKAVCTGAKSAEKSAEVVGMVFGLLLRRGLGGGDAPPVRVRDVAATADMGRRIRLASAAVSLPRSMYEPKMLPGPVHRIVDPRAVCRSFPPAGCCAPAPKAGTMPSGPRHNVHPIGGPGAVRVFRRRVRVCMGRGLCYGCGSEGKLECADRGILFCRRHGTKCDRCGEAVCSAHLAV